MQDFLFRLVTSFEQAHGVHPNLLYLNPHHIQYLQESFGSEYSMQEIMEILDMELVIDSYSTHPHVCWSEALSRVAS